MKMALRTLALALSMLVAGGLPIANAQAPAAPLGGMTKEQYDSLVDAISNVVFEKLKPEKQSGVDTRPKRTPPPAASSSKFQVKGPPPTVIARRCPTVRAVCVVIERAAPSGGGARVGNPLPPPPESNPPPGGEHSGFLLCWGSPLAPSRPSYWEFPILFIPCQKRAEKTPPPP